MTLYPSGYIGHVVEHTGQHHTPFVLLFNDEA